MQRLKFLFAATALFLVATISNKISAQEGAYAVVVSDNGEYVLRFDWFTTKPSVGQKHNGYQIYKVADPKQAVDTAKGFADNYSGSIVRVEFCQGLAGGKFNPTSTAYWFYKFKNLKTIDLLTRVKAQGVTNMEGMFKGCSSLKGVDLSNLRLEKVTNMASLFEGCTSLQAVYFGAYTISTVENMHSMFRECNSLESVSLEAIDFRKAKQISYMFYNCKKIKYIFFNKDEYIDLSNMPKATATNFPCNYIFVGCSQYLKGYCKDISVGWKYSSWKSNSQDGKATFKKAENSGYLSQTGRSLCEYYYLKDEIYLQMPESAKTIPYGGKLNLSEAYLLQKYHCMANGDSLVPYKIASLEATKCEITGFDSTKPGKQSVGIKYSGQYNAPFSNGQVSKTFTIDVEVQDAFKEYIVSTAPTKTEYTMPITVADIDISGMQIKKVMQSEKTENVSMSGLKPTITGLNTTKTGSQTITLSFNISGNTVTYQYTITVKDALKEIKVTSAPTKTEYTMPISVFDIDVSGIQIKRFYHSGLEIEHNMSDIRPIITGLNTTKIGEQTITLVYNIVGTTVTYKHTITVKDALKEYSVTSAPTKTEYTMPFTEADLDLTGGVIQKVMYSGDTEDLTMSDLTPTVSGLEPKKAGEQEITLSFTLSDGTKFEYKYVIKVIEEEKEEPGTGDEPGSGEDGDNTGEEPGEDGESGEGGSEEGGNTEEGGDEPGSEEPGEPIVALEDLNGGGAAFEVWTSRGVLSVKAARAGVLEVLNVNGVVLRREEVAGGSSVNLPLERGVYVLRFGGEVKKVVVE